MNTEKITRITETNGRLYGSCYLDNKTVIYNLSKPGNLKRYDFSNVTEGKELLEKHLALYKDD